AGCVRNLSNGLPSRKPKPPPPPLIVRELIDLANYPVASLALLELSLLRLPRVRSCREFERGLINAHAILRLTLRAIRNHIRSNAQQPGAKRRTRPFESINVRQRFAKDFAG